MVPRPHGDPLAIERLADFDWIDPRNHEGQHTHLLPGGADQAEAVDSRQAAGGVVQEFVLVGGDPLPAEGRDVVERCPEADRVGDVGRAGLELGRWLGVGRVGEGHILDHVAATLPGRERPLSFLRHEHGADAGGAEDLVAREHVEVAADPPHVHRKVRHALGPVDEHAGAAGLRHAGHQLHRQDRAEAVGGVRDRDHLRERREELRVGLEDHVAAVVDRHHADHGAGSLGHHLPGHDVGVVLEFREHDLVAAGKARGEDIGAEVDPLGAAPHVDDLVGAVGTQEVGDRLPGVLVGVGRPGGERVGPAVDVGVVVGVEVGDRVDHRLRLLRGRGVVEPGERLAVNLLVQDREVAADGGDVEEARRGRDRRHGRCRNWMGHRQRSTVERPWQLEMIEPPDAADKRPEARVVGGG